VINIISALGDLSTIIAGIKEIKALVVLANQPVKLPIH
jgi:hypothetical protein